MRKLRGIAAGLLLLGSCYVGAVASKAGEKDYSDESVVLSAAEADSVIDLIDDQGLRIKLLEVDLWEARRLAQVDSTLVAVQLQIQEQQIDDLRGNVVTRFLKHPVVWLALGVWLAGQQ